MDDNRENPPSSFKKPSSLLEIEPEHPDDESVFPYTRVKRLMQVGTDERILSESLKAMSKATELFVQDLIKKAFQFTKSKQKKTVILADFIEAVQSNQNLAFILDSGILPN